MDRMKGPLSRATSCAVFGEDPDPDGYIAAGRLPDCYVLATISQENPTMPIRELLDTFDAHRANCPMCAAIEIEDAAFERAIPIMRNHARAAELAGIDPETGCTEREMQWTARKTAVSEIQQYEKAVA